MRRSAVAMTVVLAVVILTLAAADTAEGRHGRGGFYLSTGGFSVAAGRMAFYGPVPFGIYPPRDYYGVTPFFFGFGTRSSYGRHSGWPHRGRRYGSYPVDRYRSYERGYRSYPYRGRRVWVPGGTIDGRYRSGYWEYRDFRQSRHGRHEDRHEGRHRRDRVQGRPY